MTVAGTLELAFLLAHIGSCNDTAHFPLITHGDLAGNLAAAVQFLQSKGLFIAADLQHRVRRGVYNHVPRGNLFFCQFIQNLCAAGALVSDDYSAGTGRQFIQQFLGKSRICERLEGRGNMESHHLPVAGHGILAGAGLMQIAIIAQRALHGIHLLKGMQIRQTQLLKIRDSELLHRLGDMPQRIGSRIAVSRCIRQRTGTQRIDNDGKNALILPHLNPPCILPDSLIYISII